MANYCFNIVSFSGTAVQLRDIEALFNSLHLAQEQTGKGQLPPFIMGDEGYFFNIYYSHGTAEYETKWVPNLEILKQVADHFQAGFTCSYSETANLVYGQATCQDGELRDVCLDPNDFGRYEYDEDSNTYRFEGEDYDEDVDILEIMLHRKKLAGTEGQRNTNTEN